MTQLDSDASRHHQHSHPQEDQGLRRNAALRFGLLLGLLLLAFSLKPGQSGGAELLGYPGPRCTLTQLCGPGLCPGCGLTTATMLAADGRLSDSLASHPVGIMTLLYALIGLILHGLALWRGQRSCLECRILCWGTRSYALALVLTGLWRVLT
ncbi:MAG: hypothetical protein CSA62_10840 [Planctomycetota bacterium]|nr:MAG: hypothetical protein CSA62_10840 [Planctomycetota bacterium]